MFNPSLPEKDKESLPLLEEDNSKGDIVTGEISFGSLSVIVQSNLGRQEDQTAEKPETAILTLALPPRKRTRNPNISKGNST